jgi:alkaline phosphatase
MPRTGRLRLALLVALLALPLAVTALYCDEGPVVAASPGPRNVIVMIGDGRGFNHVTAADLYRTGRAGTAGYESFPIQLAASTYSLSSNGYDPDEAWSKFGYVLETPTDSAAAATALATGHKTTNGAIGVAPSAPDDLKDLRAVENMLERAEKHGKATGVITSVELSHATPAGFVAHATSRNSYTEIGRQMIRESALEVIMGCGHPLYDGTGAPRPKTDLTDGAYQFVGGKATWLRVLHRATGADCDRDGISDPWSVVENRSDFTRLASGPTPKRLLGIPHSGTTLQQERAGDPQAAPGAVPLNEDVPTLAEMVRAGLNVLDNDPDGFTLMIEGGAIDWASHANQLGRMIEEASAFDDAVRAVADWVESHGGWDETLVIVTSDHETGYLTGPDSGSREGAAPVWNALVPNGAGAAPAAEWHAKGHSNSLVPVAAKGPGAELLAKRATGSDPVRGAYLDNTDIARLVFDLLG